MGNINIESKMKIKLRGVFNGITSYGKARIIFLSDYHFTGEIANDFSKNQLVAYDKKFIQDMDEKKWDNVIYDQLKMKNPIKSTYYEVILSKYIQYKDDHGNKVVHNHLLYKDVLLDATITNYSFKDKFTKEIKIFIVGWKITCTSITESRINLC